MAGNIEDELNQLKEQIKLLERMVYLKNNVSSSEEYITKFMETQVKLSNIMKNYNANSYDHEKKLVELLKQKAEIEEKRAKSAKERVNAEKESIKNNETLKEQNKEITKQNKEIIGQEEKFARVRAAKRVNDALSPGKSKAEQIAEERKTFAMSNPNLEGEALKKALIKNKLLDSETSSYMKDILKDFKIGNKTIGSYVSMNEKGVSSAAQLLNVGVQTFNNAVKVFSNAVSQGFKNQTKNYESNFTNIATMTGMSKETYRSNQMSLGGFGTNTLHERGLMNNIRTSEVQDMWNSLANSGMNQSDVLATALDNVITKTIVPYLDTTSEDFNILNSRINGDFVKQIRGINKANLDIAGNNYATKDVLNQLMKAVEPMSDEAIQNLAQGSEEVTTYINQLIDAGYTKDAATQKATNLFKMQKYGANDITSMRVADQLTYFGYLQNGINIYDPNQFADAINGAVETDQWIAGLTPGYTDTTSGLITNTIGGSLGTDYESMNGALKLNKKGIKGSDLLDKSKGVDADKYANEATRDLADDKLQTTKQLTDILAENLTNEVSAFAEMLGPWFDVITGALKGIAGVIGVKLIGKIGGKLLGLGGSGGSAGGLIGKGLTAFAGTGLGYQAMGVGASMGINSVPAATAAGIALPAAIAAGGIAGGAYGISEGVKDWQSGHKARGGISAAGGAAMAAGGIGVAGGMLAAGAANAWNPVGWGLLIAGGLAVAGTAIARSADSTVDLADEFDAKKQSSIKKIRAYNNEYMDNMYDVKEAISKSTSLEEAKQIALENGIISQKELNDASIKSKDSLLALANIKIEDQDKLNQGIEDLVGVYADIKNEKIGNVANPVLDLMNNASWSKNDISYENLSGTQKNEMNDFMKAYIEWANKYGNGDDKWRVEKYGTAFDDGNFHKNDWNKVFEGDNAKTRERFEAFASSDEGAKILSKYGSFKGKYGGDDRFYTLTDEEIMKYVNSAIKSDTEESAKGNLKVLKDYGLTWDKLGSKIQDPLKAKFGDGISSYRVGTDSIPYDNYPAMLHEGEAVLTASTANELRGLVDEYRATKEDNIKLEKAIQDQTTVLVSRLDAIYNKIGNPDSDTSIMPRKIRQRKSNG